MAAPKGNRFWENRSTHGRDKIFTNPALLEQEANAYFEWADATPLISVEIYGKDAIPCNVPKMRALTIKGLCLYLGVHSQYFRDFKEGLDTATNPIDKEFSLVIARIEEIIWTQKYEGAAAGMLHATIVSREIGLVEKTDVTSFGEKIDIPVINIVKPEGV